MAKKLNRPVFLLKLNTIGWFILFGLDLLQNYSQYVMAGVDYPWVTNLSFIIPHFFNLWLLAIPVYYIWNRWQPSPGPIVYFMLFIGGLIFGSIHIGLTYFDQKIITWLPEAEQFPNGFFASLMESIGQGLPLVLRSFLFYSLIIIALVAIDFYKKYTEQYLKSVELENQLSTATLRALKMQLHPHFLFNALNTISMMVRRNRGSKAVDMISGLSDMLRGTLWKSDKQMVPLRNELNLLNKYLDIEKVRFKDKLEIDINVGEKCMDWQVPNLITLPILENAFKHGTTKQMKASKIEISAACNNGKLELSVYNEGPLLSPDFKLEHESGTGLQNTLDRLEQLYGSSYSFNIHNKEKGVEVILHIPRYLNNS